MLLLELGELGREGGVGGVQEIAVFFELLLVFPGNRVRGKAPPMDEPQEKPTKVFPSAFSSSPFHRAPSLCRAPTSLAYRALSSNDSLLESRNFLSNSCVVRESCNIALAEEDDDEVAGGKAKSNDDPASPAPLAASPLVDNGTVAF